MKAPFHWDKYSDQPYILKDKVYKKAKRKENLFDYIKLLLINIFMFPVAMLTMNLFKKKQNTNNSLNFYGIGVNLDKGDVQVELVEELGINNLLIRIPLSDIQNINSYYLFTKKFSDKKIVLNILQDREHIEDMQLLKKDITTIFETFKDITNEFQIGNAINRTKWGFFSIGEYLKFYTTIQTIRNEKYKDIELIGPSIIDFEYHYTIRALFNLYNIKFDKLSSLLYVDRRGSPFNTQIGIFNTTNKINMLYALTKLSSKTSDDIYITEVNWPLSNTAPYSPTSQKECVDEETYSKYMIEYFECAKNTGKISKVFWHQLFAPGYGLVDNRDGKIRKTEAFYKFKELIKNAK